MPTVAPADIFGYFSSLGYPAESAGAITGNAFGESSFNSNAIGDNGNSFGLWQFGPSNQRLFQQQFGMPIQQATWQQQASFVAGQLQGNPAYANLNSTLMQGGSVGDMTRAFEASFERPKSLADVGSRTAAAAKAVAGGGSSLAGAATDAGITAINSLLPGAGSALASGLGFLGVKLPGQGGSPSLLQQFEQWLANSHFWQRFALGVLALIFIGGAIFLLGNKSGINQTIVKAAATVG